MRDTTVVANFLIDSGEVTSLFGQNARAIQEDEISSRGNHACGARSEE